MSQRRQWHPTPVLLPGKSHEWGSLVGPNPPVAESDTTEWLHFHALEKEMATHPSIAWRIPGTGKPGGLPSMGSHRVGHSWSDLAAAAERLTQQICQKMAFCSVWLFTWSHAWHPTILYYSIPTILCFFTDPVRWGWGVCVVSPKGLSLYFWCQVPSCMLACSGDSARWEVWLGQYTCQMVTQVS